MLFRSGFAQKHGIKVGTIADLIAHRRRTESVIERLQESTLESRHGGRFRMIVYVNKASYAEHVLPILLVLGLFTRLSAFGLLMMTAVIQIFVYPSAWPTHLSWATLALFPMFYGGGRFAVDRLIP